MSDVVVGSEPGTIDLVTRRGDEIPPFQLDWGDGVDLSDRDWAAQARGDLDEGPLTATLDVDVSEAADGKLVVSMRASESRKLETPHPLPGYPEVPGDGVYFWDLQATSKTNAESVKTWVSGQISVSGDVTVVEG